MTVPQEKIALILLYSFILGAVLGLIYDFFRIKRIAYNLNKNKIKKMMENTIVFFEDITYWLICSVFVCVFLFYINSGRARGISLFVMLSGFLVYYFTVGKLVVRCSERIIELFYKMLRKIYSIFIRPLLIILKLLCKITVYRLYLYIFTLIKKKLSLRKAEYGFGILKIAKIGKNKDEKSFKHIRKSGGAGVHSVLHGYDRKNAI